MTPKLFYRYLFLKIYPRSLSRLALASLVLIGAAACGPKTPSPAQTAAAIGGDFQLTNTAGRRVDQSLLRGKWSAVFFGYTYCPDVCPTTLTTLGQAMIKLGDKAARAQVVFITVDPARDTSAQLKTYLAGASFPKGVIGLTGSAADIAAVARAYRVYYKKVPDGATYSMDHTAVIYLMDPRGRFVAPVDPSQSPADVADQIAKAMTAG